MRSSSVSVALISALCASGARGVSGFGALRSSYRAPFTIYRCPYQGGINGHSCADTPAQSFVPGRPWMDETAVQCLLDQSNNMVSCRSGPATPAESYTELRGPYVISTGQYGETVIDITLTEERKGAPETLPEWTNTVGFDVTLRPQKENWECGRPGTYTHGARRPEGCWSGTYEIRLVDVEAERGIVGTCRFEPDTCPLNCPLELTKIYQDNGIPKLRIYGCDDVCDANDQNCNECQSPASSFFNVNPPTADSSPPSSVMMFYDGEEKMQPDCVPLDAGRTFLSKNIGEPLGWMAGTWSNDNGVTSTNFTSMTHDGGVTWTETPIPFVTTSVDNGSNDMVAGANGQWYGVTSNQCQIGSWSRIAMGDDPATTGGWSNCAYDGGF